MDDPTVDPRFGRVGKQTIEDTGALTRKRMETIDDETSAAAVAYMKRQQAAGKPFFVWFNATRMHLRTHVRAEHRGRYTHGDSEYIDGMQEHDDTVGTLLKALDDMGIANDTLVVYSTDNGPHMNTWPDGAMTWFRSEKNTNWEGAFRVPCLVRWPGTIKPGTVTNEIMSHNDWIPTLAAIAGEPDLVGKLKAGYAANGITYKVHLDGYDQSAFLKAVSGTAGNNNGARSARDKFFYSDDDGLLVGTRQGDLKYVFSEQRMQGTMGLWAEPFTTLRLQKIFNLMQDPFERADITSNTYWDWNLNHVGSAYGMMDEVFQFVATFKDFPPCSFPPSFNPANILEGTLDTIKQKEAFKKGLDPRQDPRRPEQDDRPTHSNARLAMMASRRPARSTGPATARIPMRSPGVPDRGQGMHFIRRAFLAAVLFTAAALAGAASSAQEDPLPSWNGGAAKQGLVEFVGRVTRDGGPDFVPEARRIAVFDNDGTLWAEQPVYFQVAFALDQVKALAPEHPEWKDTEPFKGIIAGDTKAVAAAGEKGLLQVMAATHAGMTTDAFNAIVADWLKTARHPRFDRPYDSLVYQPMLELLGYLRANGFKTFIVSGGGVEFMRVFAERSYGIPPEQVVGSSGVTQFEIGRDGMPVLLKEAKVEFIDDGPGKPSGINRFIGRQPILAFGNSDGDQQMLEWTTGGSGPRFLGLVHHTDAQREYAYDRKSHVGHLDKALDEAVRRGWTVVDMRRDWSVIFPKAPGGRQ